MFAVIGTWRMGADLHEKQQAGLPALVEGVRSNPGFVTGYWTSDVDDANLSVTFIVFETRDQAEHFRAAVMANAPAQVETGVERAGLRIVEVTAQA